MNTLTSSQGRKEIILQSATLKQHYHEYRNSIVGEEASKYNEGLWRSTVTLNVWIIYTLTNKQWKVFRRRFYISSYISLKCTWNWKPTVKMSLSASMAADIVPNRKLRRRGYIQIFWRVPHLYGDTIRCYIYCFGFHIITRWELCTLNVHFYLFISFQIITLCTISTWLLITTDNYCPIKDKDIPTSERHKN